MINKVDKLSSSDWVIKKGQRVELILDAHNIVNSRVAKIGDTGTIISDYIDKDGKVRVKIDGKHYPISITCTKLMPITKKKSTAHFLKGNE